MKKILSFLTLVTCLFLNIVTYAQTSYSAGITVDIVPLNPQTGSYNYFGISVTLDKIYDQNVTINGYIFDALSTPNTNTPFSVTVYTGYTSAQTSSTFYQTDPTSDANYSLSTIFPAIISSGGSNYNTQNLIVGCGPENANNPYDYTGLLHNHALNYFISSAPTLNSASDVANAVTAYFQANTTHGDSIAAFFASSTTSSLRTSFANASNICDVFTSYGLSTAFCTYYNSLVTACSDDTQDYMTIYSSLVSVESNISNATSLSTIEKQMLLVSASVFRYSFFYWGIDENISNWESYSGQTYASIGNANEHISINPMFKEEDSSPKSWTASTNYVLSTNSYSDENTGSPNISFLESSKYEYIYPVLRNSSEKQHKKASYYFKWSWRSFGKADGKGAIEGAVAGAIGGAWIAGPPGGLAGAIGGGIAWGAGCSVSNAVGQLTGWW